MEYLKKAISVLWLIITLGVLIILFIYIKNMTDSPSQLISDILVNPEVGQESQSSQYVVNSENIRVKAYFINVTSQCLEPVNIDVEYGENYESTCHNVISTMQRQSTETLISPIPKDLTIRGIYLLDDGELIIDLPSLVLRELPLSHSAIGELLWIYSLTDTLLQDELCKKSKVKGLRVLVEGNEPELSFFEHLDITSVFLPDYLPVCDSNL